MSVSNLFGRYRESLVIRVTSKKLPFFEILYRNPPAFESSAVFVVSMKKSDSSRTLVKTKRSIKYDETNFSCGKNKAVYTFCPFQTVFFLDPCG
jgi:hypothetical protein